MSRYDLIRKSLEEETLDEFEDRVERQSEFLKEEFADERLDNPDYTVGLEIEVYGVDKEGCLASLPDELYGTCEGMNKELGLHNAEVNTSPTVLGGGGLRAQEEQVRRTLERSRDALGDTRLIFDSMWTIPPECGTHDYFSSVERDNGYVFADNMRANRRYEAIDNFYLDRFGDVEIDVPGASLSFPTILVESLATSIQPHLQVPRADDLPDYYNTALRTMPAVLALSTNSPFLPPDLYDAPDAALLDETHHELRIDVFEQSVNPSGGYDDKKVRFPTDIESTEDVVDKIVADTTYSPMLSDWGDEDGDGEEGVSDYTDKFWEFNYKRGTYWRWLRAVIGGESVEDNDQRSVRIEYRPLPTQPSVRDTVGLQALVSGLVIGLVEAGHPLASLDWDEARDAFYAAAEDGIDARLAWVDEDGEFTRDAEKIYTEVFEYARRGLVKHAEGGEVYDEYVAPLRRRFDERTTPSVWKVERAREALDDGAGFEEAVHEAQRAYFQRFEMHDSFADWI